VTSPVEDREVEFAEACGAAITSISLILPCAILKLSTTRSRTDVIAAQNDPTETAAISAKDFYDSP
jgi:hypothetical protein